jgi:hypothetical protein
MMVNNKLVLKCAIFVFWIIIFIIAKKVFQQEVLCSSCLNNSSICHCFLWRNPISSAVISAVVRNSNAPILDIIMAATLHGEGLLSALFLLPCFIFHLHTFSGPYDVIVWDIVR